MTEFSKIKFGDGITVTDEGENVIRVDAASSFEWAAYRSDTFTFAGSPGYFQSFGQGGGGSDLSFVKLGGSSSNFTTEDWGGNGISVPSYSQAGGVFHVTFSVSFTIAPAASKVVQTTVDQMRYYSGAWHQFSAAAPSTYAPLEVNYKPGDTFPADTTTDFHSQTISESSMLGFSGTSAERSAFSPWVAVRDASMTGIGSWSARMLIVKLP